MSSKSAKLVLAVGLILLLTIQASASIIVAARDSVKRKKADYKCDGKDDQVQIQKAIDALGAEGGVIELLEGTFNFGDTVNITKSNVTIKGAGKSTILKHNPTSWVKLTKDAKKGGKTITVEDVSQFRVGQLIGIANEYIAPTSASPERLAEICGSSGCPYYVTYYTNCEIHLIEKIKGKTITIRGLENDMPLALLPRVAPAWVMIRACDKTNLELNSFSIDCNRDNVARVYAGGRYSHHAAPFPSEGDPNHPKSLTDRIHHGEELTSAIYMESAHNSKFQNLYLHDIPMSGIFLINSNYVLVEGNTIRDFGLKGYVDCFGDYTQIIGNVVENSVNEDGIIIYHGASHYAIVSNNIVRNCTRGCILLNQARRAVVTGNNVYGTGGQEGVGIFVCTPEATITGNYIENAGTGISVWAPIFVGGDHPITITGNSIRDCYTAFGMSKINNLNLTGNVVSGKKDVGIAISSTGATSGNGFIISNNQFLNSSSEKPAIQLGGDNHFIFGNKIKGFKKGVWLESTAEKNVVERNEFADIPEKIVDEGKDNIKDGNL